MTDNPSIPPALDYTIVFESDWHIGTGAGRVGDLDRLVRRDADGLPFVPAKTVTGMWRDACELVAAGLDADSDDKAWSAWVRVLFGDQPAIGDSPGGSGPRAAAVAVGPARHHPALRAAVASRPLLAEAMTFGKSGVRIDRASGRAMDDNLRFEEMARLGSRLHGKCELTGIGVLDEPQQQTATALLVAGATLVRGIGGKRRRGAGRCRLELGEGVSTAWIDWLDRTYRPAAPPATAPVPSVPAHGVPRPTTPMKASWLDIRLDIAAGTPVLVPLRTRGNVVTTNDTIPGTVLLGALSRPLARAGVDVADALARDELVIGDAVPTTSDGSNETLPAPASLVRAKNDPARTWNLLDPSHPPPADEQLKAVRGGFVDDLTSGLRHVDVDRVAVTHGTIDDQRQRPTTATGGVFTYEALAPGTHLVAHLRIKTAVDKDSLLERLRGSYRVGQSKKDDYGQVTIDASIVERSRQHDDVAEGGELVVWLLSDVVIPDRRLRPVTTLDALHRAVATGVGLEVDRLELVEAPAGPPGAGEQEFVRSVTPVRRDAWLAGRGLARGSLVALQRGSVVRFRTTVPVQGAAIAQLQASGVGIRRGEGFGRIAVNHPSLSKTMAAAEPTASPAGADLAPTAGRDTIETDRPLLDALERAAWRRAIQRAAIDLALDSRRATEAAGLAPGRNEPGKSQRGSLRRLVLDLDTFNEAAREGAVAWLDHLEDTPKRKKRWPQQLRTQVRELLTSETAVWEALGLSNELVAGLSIDDADQRKAELWGFAVRTLLSTCARSTIASTAGDEGDTVETDDEGAAS